MAGIGHGAKLLTLMRRETGSSHAGALILFEGETGEPVAVMDAGLPTALRTAAASAVATDALSRRDAVTLAILGTGEAAAWHIEAMRTVRPLSEVRIWGRRYDKAAALAQRHQHAHVAATVDEACAGADIICTVTSSAAPILQAAQLPEGVHVNAVGASIPSSQEIAPDCHRVCRTVVDYRPSADVQAGELIAARAAGMVEPECELPEIGEVLSGKVPGRDSGRQRTLYRSLGVIAQDLATANFLLRRAEAAGRGVLLDLYK